MLDDAGRWGILPAYDGWQGDVVETTRSTTDAILAALGAKQDRPPRIRRLKLPHEPCAPAPDRAWGWAIQLYALRSRDSWGIGDLADLRRFGRWSRRRGASVILLNPLGAQTPTVPYEPSPYYASTRRFRNTLYLRIEEVEGAERCAAELQPLREAASKLNQRRLIDYDQVFQLKSRALEYIFQAAPKPQGLDAWVRRQGRALDDFATFKELAGLSPASAQRRDRAQPPQARRPHRVSRMAAVPHRSPARAGRPRDRADHRRACRFRLGRV